MFLKSDWVLFLCSFNFMANAAGEEDITLLQKNWDILNKSLEPLLVSHFVFAYHCQLAAL